MFEDMVISAFLLVFTTDVDNPVEEAPCDNWGVVEVVVDETVDVVFAGGSHFTLKFPLSPP